MTPSYVPITAADFVAQPSAWSEFLSSDLGILVRLVTVAILALGWAYYAYCGFMAWRAFRLTRRLAATPEPVTTRDDASSLNDEWADIEEIIKAENAN
ncbi:hypothetical protein RI570_06595 [Brucella pseudogrignonensis]|uniref:hypothetical protein n=1 Tax=Brucella pseudogrignonensis TaxID=419475 RepID=UPI0028BBF165|nr:hypothetical protein [Brucella pseudogrignonensis]MDT6939812.1 hypothetical protein [Brucella pseudogrignonensis]